MFGYVVLRNNGFTAGIHNKQGKKAINKKMNNGKLLLHPYIGVLYEEWCLVRLVLHEAILSDQTK